MLVATVRLTEALCARRTFCVCEQHYHEGIRNPAMLSLLACRSDCWLIILLIMQLDFMV